MAIKYRSEARYHDQTNDEMLQVIIKILGLARTLPCNSCLSCDARHASGSEMLFSGNNKCSHTQELTDRQETMSSSPKRVDISQRWPAGRVAQGNQDTYRAPLGTERVRSVIAGTLFLESSKLYLR
jgi:hypothetical protein